MNDPRAAGVAKWGCSKCKGEEYESEDTFRDSRNCDGKGGKLYFDFDFDLTSCPNITYSGEDWYWFACWQDWESWRLLPGGGSDLMAEPYYVYEAFKVMTCERVIVENETAERQYKKEEREHKKWQKTQKS